MLTPNMLVHGRYRIIRHIAGGGMGSVYQATDERLGHTVALKQLLLSDPTAQYAFEREAKLLAPLHHAAIPNVSDYFSDPAGQFLVMRYIPGDDLSRMLEQLGQPFPVGQVLAWVDQLLSVLDYLHRQGIIHRDIKPQNLKLNSDGEVMLLDFGIAKNTGNSSMMAATPGFAPIEQLQGLGTDPRSDLYALGATAYCLLTARLPASSVTRVVAASQQQPDPLQPLHLLNPQVPPAVSNVLMYALAVHPTHRPPDAATMRQMLRDASSSQPQPQPQPQAQSRTRWGGMVVGGGVALLVAAVVLALVLLGGNGDGSTASRAATDDERGTAASSAPALPTDVPATPEPTLIPTNTPLPPPTVPPEPTPLPELGVPTTPPVAGTLPLSSSERSAGMLITAVTPGSVAEARGLRVGQWIVGVDGVLIDGYNETWAAFNATREASLIVVTEDRVNGRRLVGSVPNAYETLQICRPDICTAVSAGQLSPSLRDAGAEITNINDDSLAFLIGLTPGTVIHAVNNQAVYGVEDTRSAVGANIGSTVPIVVSDRGKNARVITVVLSDFLGVGLCEGRC